MIFAYIKEANLRVAEAVLGTSVGANNTIKVGAGTMGSEIVADGAQVLEKFLSFAGISFNLLLGGHYVLV